MDKKWYVLIALGAVAVLLLAAFFGIAIYGACAPEEAFYDEQGNEQTGLVHSIMTVFRSEEEKGPDAIPVPDEQDENKEDAPEQDGDREDTTQTNAPQTTGQGQATNKPTGTTASPAATAPATATPVPTPEYDGEGYSQEGWEEGDEIIVDFDDLFGTP